MKCSKCGSRDIDFQEAGGQSICVNCGTILEENTIVSSIEFQVRHELSSGRSLLFRLNRRRVIGHTSSANMFLPTAPRCKYCFFSVFPELFFLQ